jgi:subtilisin-like proprotein convertase family protein
VRLRAASQKANLDLDRPRIENGRLKAQGTISRRAEGLVRVQLQYVVDDQTETVELRGRISDGRWNIDQALPASVREGIAQREGTLHSYTLFTGYFERRIRGEMRSFEVLGAR